MTRFVSPGGIEVTTPTVDGVQRFRVEDLGGIGGRTRRFAARGVKVATAAGRWPRDRATKPVPRPAAQAPMRLPDQRRGGNPPRRSHQLR